MALWIWRKAKLRFIAERGKLLREQRSIAPVSPCSSGSCASAPIVTVGIKALNEEKNIARALTSALDAVRPFGGDVILADSGSSDRTIEIAQQFPVRIFQLANPAERSCGAGAQLAFQHARGRYFYLLDGDMVLDPSFLRAGISFLEGNVDVAAVGGYVTERNTEGQSFQISAESSRADANRMPGLVDRLDGGGLYRIAAVAEVGYFADRNLHGYEEFELAARLRSQGWYLARIDHAAADHYGHTIGGYRLLWRRLATGYSDGAGEVLRAALWKSHLGIVMSRLRHVHYCFSVIIWWCSLLLSISLSPLAFSATILAPIIFLSIRRRSLRLGFYSFTSWNVMACGMIKGFFRTRVPPTDLLVSVPKPSSKDPRVPPTKSNLRTAAADS